MRPTARVRCSTARKGSGSTESNRLGAKALGCDGELRQRRRRVIAIGVYNGKIEGVDGQAKQINEWQQAAANFTQPPIPHVLEQLACIDETGARKRRGRRGVR